MKLRTILIIGLIIILLITIIFITPKSKAVSSQQNIKIKDIKLSGLVADKGKKIQKVEKPPIPEKRKKSQEQIISEIITKLESEIDIKESNLIANLVIKKSNQYKLDPYWMLAIMYTESRFKRNAVSNRGARGLMQLMPRTAKQFGVNSTKQLHEPEININAGFKHYKFLLDKYDNNKMATIAYNQGVGNVSRGTYKTWYYNKVNKAYKSIMKLKNN